MINPSFNPVGRPTSPSSPPTTATSSASPSTLPHAQPLQQQQQPQAIPSAAPDVLGSLHQRADRPSQPQGSLFFSSPLDALAAVTAVGGVPQSHHLSAQVAVEVDGVSRATHVSTTQSSASATITTGITAPKPGATAPQITITPPQQTSATSLSAVAPALSRGPTESSQRGHSTSEMEDTDEVERSPTSSTPSHGVPARPMTHALVRFNRLFGVYYVPTLIRRTVSVGELVLCESAHGESTGTIVWDVSALVEAEAKRRQSASTDPSAADPLFPYDAPIEAAMSVMQGPLYDRPVECGLPYDDRMQRLPRVLRRGVNKDKKKVYFARFRDNEAGQTILRTLIERGIRQLAVEEAEYQVDFLMITLHLRGKPEDLQWTPAAYSAVGSSLAGPLRTDFVVFRHSESDPNQLHLTRHLFSKETNEQLLLLGSTSRDDAVHSHGRFRRVPGITSTSSSSTVENSASYSAGFTMAIPTAQPVQLTPSQFILTAPPPPPSSGPSTKVLLTSPQQQTGQPPPTTSLSLSAAGLPTPLVSLVSPSGYASTPCATASNSITAYSTNTPTFATFQAVPQSYVLTPNDSHSFAVSMSLPPPPPPPPNQATAPLMMPMHALPYRSTPPSTGPPNTTMVAPPSHTSAAQSAPVPSAPVLYYMFTPGSAPQQAAAAPGSAGPMQAMPQGAQRTPMSQGQPPTMVTPGLPQGGFVQLQPGGPSPQYPSTFTGQPGQQPQDVFRAVYWQ